MNLVRKGHEQADMLQKPFYRLKRHLIRERFAVDRGELASAILLLTVAVHLWIAVVGPDRNGHLFHGGVFLEAVGESSLMVSPFVCIYAACRALSRNRQVLLPYLAASGAGFLAAFCPILGADTRPASSPLWRLPPEASRRLGQLPKAAFLCFPPGLRVN
jgi:hypothetical protein